MPKTLDEVLSSVVLIGMAIELDVWINVKNDKPVTTTVVIAFPSNIEAETCREVIRRVNQYLPIFGIGIGGKEYFRITDMETYMKKPCEGCK